MIRLDSQAFLQTADAEFVMIRHIQTRGQGTPAAANRWGCLSSESVSVEI